MITVLNWVEYSKFYDYFCVKTTFEKVNTAAAVYISLPEKRQDVRELILNISVTVSFWQTHNDFGRTAPYRNMLKAQTDKLFIIQVQKTLPIFQKLIESIFSIHS